MTPLPGTEGLALPKHSADTLRLSFYLLPSQFSLKCRDNTPHPLSFPMVQHLQISAPGAYRRSQLRAPLYTGVHQSQTCNWVLRHRAAQMHSKRLFPGLNQAQTTARCSGCSAERSTSLCPPCVPSLPVTAFEAPFSLS